MKLYAQKVDGKPLQYDRQMLKKHIADLPPGCYELEIKKAKKDKSSNQLGAHFGLMISRTIELANDMGLDTSSFLKEMVRDDLPNGIGLTKNFLKEIFYCLCPMYSEDGKRITLSRASTVQASKHLEDCRNLLAGHGIYIPEPNPDYKTKSSKVPTQASR